jgi:hypothetical protein
MRILTVSVHQGVVEPRRKDEQKSTMAEDMK